MYINCPLDASNTTNAAHLLVIKKQLSNFKNEYSFQITSSHSFRSELAHVTYLTKYILLFNFAACFNDAQQMGYSDTSNGKIVFCKEIICSNNLKIFEFEINNFALNQHHVSTNRQLLDRMSKLCFATWSYIVSHIFSSNRVYLNFFQSSQSSVRSEITFII